ncbi:SAM-dependent methyltransferase [Alkalicoccobacillus murimartini]|uniref:tRNA-Thr(GGU) m(6)t(6)A37 methyltransferase TsaA n=1 Tax=Alkalicoccobacillus murimartini TaxID=171685 RepID=A0ABT9YMV9_9BACI|nr:SAM-dependent methyltransferase [Alkalicoccobacillus murimartini]MDQ0208831.1 tRNA-Thr(GGU) m(6)t(6)A37 methyltransferase TsaA [Alkalicoccobacillus murimartini]
MFTIEAIGTVSNKRREIEDDNWGSVQSTILVNDSFSEESLAGVETFSHLEVLFYFHKVKEEKIMKGARHPRNNPALPLVGIFAQRGKNRPNRLGLTTVKLISRQGKCLVVEGLDCIDGTPIIDIKPVMKEFLPHGPVIQPEWSHDLMKEYWSKK